MHEARATHHHTEDPVPLTTDTPTTWRPEWRGAERCAVWTATRAMCRERSTLRRVASDTTASWGGQGEPTCTLHALADLAWYREAIRDDSEALVHVRALATELGLAASDVEQMLATNRASHRNLATALRQVRELRTVTAREVEVLVAMAPTWAGTSAELLEAATILAK